MESFQKILAQVFEVLKPIARFILNLPLIVQILGGIVLFILLLITIFRFTYSGKIASAVNKNKGENLASFCGNAAQQFILLTHVLS